MRTKTGFALVLLAALFLANGCIVTSLNPLYTEDDSVFMEELVGTWKEEGDDELWMFEKMGDKKAYNLYIYGKQQKISLDKETGAPANGKEATQANPYSIGKFEVALVRLGDTLFLDMFPESPEDGNMWYYLHTVPVHSFMKVSISGDSLSITMLDIEWFKNKIENGEDVGIDYVSRDEDDMVILSAPTKELQSFMLKNADNEEMFDDEEVMTRVFMIQTKQMPMINYR